MILERLIELRNRLLDDPESGLTPAYHKRQGAKWILEVTADGKFAGFLMSGRTKKEIKEFDTPYAKRTSAPYPLLLADKSEYVLGDGDGRSDSSRHSLYRHLVDDCAKEVENPALHTYAAFLHNENEVEHARIDAGRQDIAAGDLILPRIDGKILTNDRRIQRFWQEQQDREAGEKSSLEAHCMNCGEWKPIARTHPVELLVGADRVSMVTGNADAFLSYGLQQSEIAPMCQACARGYGEALNWLLHNENHRLRTGDMTWIFWTRYPSELDIIKLLNEPTTDEVRHLLKSPRAGSRPVDDKVPNTFYALALSSNKSRLIVRNWLTVSLAEARENLLRYFERQQMAGRDGSEAPIKLMALAGATVRDLKDLFPQVVPALLNNAFTGAPLPDWLLQQAIARARAERDNVMTRPRAALIKMVLLSQSYSKEEIMPTLNPDHSHPAYQCGRLLAVLDEVQRNAISPRATLVDRYYGAASVTPAVVFGALVRNAQNHLSKFRRDKTHRGRFVYYDRMITDIMSRIESFPLILPLRDQGLFALGFYQQKNRSRPAERPDGVEENEAVTVE